MNPQWLDTPDFASVFQAQYHRPPPWFDLVAAEELSALFFTLSQHLRITPTTILRTLLAAAHDRLSFPPKEAGMYRGGIEPLSQAFARLCIPATDAVFVCNEHQPVLLHIRAKDLIAFERHFFHDDDWIIDEQARWLYHGRHDWPGYLLRF